MEVSIRKISNMKLLTLTLTGADDKVNPVELAKLSQEYPFIEWAILLSDQREGTLRYPSKEWRTEFYKASPDSNKAAHLCGKEVLARLVAQDSELVTELKEYKRIQLNFNATRLDESELYELERCVKSGIYAHKSGVLTKFITQHNEANAYITPRFCEIEGHSLTIHQVLFDASGGLGKSPDAWPPALQYKLCGYAGGLGPDNIASELHKIETVIGKPFNTNNPEMWIDMESKLRTDDEFDLNKVKAVAEVVQHYINKSKAGA